MALNDFLFSELVCFLNMINLIMCNTICMKPHTYQLIHCEADILIVSRLKMGETNVFIAHILHTFEYGQIAAVVIPAIMPKNLCFVKHCIEKLLFVRYESNLEIFPS